MTIRNFVPEIWSAQLLTAMRKSLIYGGPGVVNRDYEGEIRQAGDTVRITSISRPSVGDYVPGNTSIVPQALNTGQRSLVVDQAKYWSFEVDDVDQAQAKGSFIPQASDEAGYALADVQDQYLASFWTSIPSSQILPGDSSSVDTITLTDEEAGYRKVYDKILVPLKVQLDELNVPANGRYVILPPWVHGFLIRDARFIEADKSADASALRNGQVGQAAGFAILSSNNTPNPETNVNVIQAGTDRAITWAEQVNKTEAFRPESSFSDAVKGLALYGGKLVRPDSIVAAKVLQDTATP